MLKLESKNYFNLIETNLIMNKVHFQVINVQSYW